MDSQTISYGNKGGKAENLLIAGIVAYYFVQVLFLVWNNGLFNNLGIDYLSFWSSGHIANTQGPIYIYDLDKQAAVQGDYAPIEKIGVVPTPLFPVFIIPFQILALVPPGISFLAWTIINIVVFFLYIRKRILLNTPIKYLLLCLIAAPFFQNIYFGQVEVWLMIFASEFLISWTQGKFFKSGLWLGLLLLKPQVLILIIPYLVIRKYWKIIAGFVTASFFSMLISFFLIGTKGLLQILNLWLGYSTGLPSNNPEAMMNWRMLGLHLGRLTSPTVGMIVVILGSAITLTLCLPFFINRDAERNSIPLIPLFGIFSASLAITWHSHQHMSLILIPFLFHFLQDGSISTKLFRAWIFAPIFSYVAAIPIGILIFLNLLPMLNGIGSFITGTCMLSFNMLFVYAAKKMHRNESLLA